MVCRCWPLNLSKMQWSGNCNFGHGGGEKDYYFPGTLLLMSHPNRGFLAPKWVTHHFWEIHICGAAPLSINAILPICEGLIAARMTLCAVVNTSHPHIPETHQKSRMKAFVG